MPDVDETVNYADPVFAERTLRGLLDRLQINRVPILESPSSRWYLTLPSESPDRVPPYGVEQIARNWDTVVGGAQNYLERIAQELLSWYKQGQEPVLSKEGLFTFASLRVPLCIEHVSKQYAAPFFSLYSFSGTGLCVRDPGRNFSIEYRVIQGAVPVSNPFKSYPFFAWYFAVGDDPSHIPEPIQELVRNENAKMLLAGSGTRPVWFFTPAKVPSYVAELVTENA